MDEEHNGPGRAQPIADDAGGHEALAVLRGIWTVQRQSVGDLGGTTKVCKNMKNIGFGGLADGGAAAVDSTAGPVDDGQRVAWREQLEREGKVPPGSRSLRDLLLDPSEPRA